MPPASTPDPGPTAECLLARLGQLKRFLRCRGFSEYVIERAIDRVIQAALPYISKSAHQSPCPLKNRVAWLFASVLKAARQEASREPHCDFVDPTDLCREPASDGQPLSAVWDALSQLTAPQRDAVYFCIMRGLSLAEAGAEMGCGPATVLRHRDRALRKLRRLLSICLLQPDTDVH